MHLGKGAHESRQIAFARYMLRSLLTAIHKIIAETAYILSTVTDLYVSTHTATSAQATMLIQC